MIKTCIAQRLRAFGAFERASPAFEIIALSVMACTLWLATHNYIGIYHDAIIYSLLAAHWLDPSSYANDLFFVFGSQDDLNLFTPVFGWLVSLFGLDLANRFVTLLGGALWISGGSLLAYRVFGLTLPFRFVVLAVAATSLSYSPNGYTFVLNENFATARVIAMPLVVFAIWGDLCGQRLLALGALLGASLLHPLLGVWGLLAFICTRLPASWLLLGVCCGVGLVALNDSQPLSTHLATMSLDWVEAVLSSSNDVLFDDLGSINLDRFLWSISVLWAGARLGNGLLRRYYLVVGLMTACGCLLTLYCSYINPVELFVQIQFWRILWLATALGWLALADILWRAIRSGWPGCVALCFAAIVTYLAGSYAWFMVMAFSIVFGSQVGVSAAEKIAALFSTHIYPGFLILTFLLFIALPSYLIDLDMLGMTLSGKMLENELALRGWLLGGGLGLGFLSLAWLCGYRWSNLAILLFCAPCFVRAAICWDMRPVETQLRERSFLKNNNLIHPFASFVKPGDVIAWPGHELDVWFVLRASNYASSTQAVGIVFSEQKMREVRTRLERMVAASLLNDASQRLVRPEVAFAHYTAEMSGLGSPLGFTQRHSSEQIAVQSDYLCKDDRLHWFVVSSPINDDNFVKPVHHYSDHQETYYLFSCNSFR